MASSLSCTGADSEEFGLDGSEKSCMFCSHVGGTCNVISCKAQQIDELCLLMEDLKCTTDMRIGHYVNQKLHGGDIPNDEFPPQTEEMTNEHKHDDMGQAFVAVEHNATLTEGCSRRRGLCKSATFPCSNLQATNIIKMDEAGGPDQQKADLPKCSWSNSLPFQASVKLVSAMKGGREQQGIIQTTKPRVTWAADVVDPPVTSVSHTVRSSQHRPKHKKDKTHKHGKGKSNHSSGSGRRKQHSKRSTASMDNLHSRLDSPAQFPMDDRILMDNMDDAIAGVDYVPTVSSSHLLEFAVAGHDKCGSSFLREAIGKMHLPYAEAT